MAGNGIEDIATSVQICCILEAVLFCRNVSCHNNIASFSEKCQHFALFIKVTLSVTGAIPNSLALKFFC